MYKASYRYWRSNDYDDQFPLLVGNINKRISSNDDDFLMMCVGETGTGKSALTMHAYELYDPENASVSFIGLDPQSHAQALKRASVYKGKRFCAMDEANVQRRNATTKYNKSLIDLFFAIRGKGIFHWWNNPSLDVIDRILVEEKINGIIYIYTKDKDKPRSYYYFTKKSILKMLEKNKGKITLKQLSEQANEFAMYRGWFKKYDGDLLTEYNKVKDERMTVKIENFFDLFGTEDTITSADAAKQLGVSSGTITNYKKSLLKSDEIEEGVHYKVNAARKFFWLAEGIETIRDALMKKDSEYAFQ